MELITKIKLKSTKITLSLVIFIFAFLILTISLIDKFGISAKESNFLKKPVYEDETSIFSFIQEESQKQTSSFLQDKNLLSYSNFSYWERVSLIFFLFLLCAITVYFIYSFNSKQKLLEKKIKKETEKSSNFPISKRRFKNKLKIHKQINSHLSVDDVIFKDNFNDIKDIKPSEVLFSNRIVEINPTLNYQKIQGNNLLKENKIIQNEISNEIQKYDYNNINDFNTNYYKNNFNNENEINFYDNIDNINGESFNFGNKEFAKDSIQYNNSYFYDQEIQKFGKKEIIKVTTNHIFLNDEETIKNFLNELRLKKKSIKDCYITYQQGDNVYSHDLKDINEIHSLSLNKNVLSSIKSISFKIKKDYSNSNYSSQVDHLDTYYNSRKALPLPTVSEAFDLNAQLIPKHKYYKKQNFLAANVHEGSNNNLKLFKNIYDHSELSIVSFSESILASKSRKEEELHLDNFRLIRHFVEPEKIGEGGFGSVLKVKNTFDKHVYAIKVIKLLIEKNKKIQNHSVIKEVHMMTKMNHKNVVRYYDCWFEKNNDFEKISKLNEASMSSKAKSSVGIMSPENADLNNHELNQKGRKYLTDEYSKSKISIQLVDNFSTNSIYKKAIFSRNDYLGSHKSNQIDNSSHEVDEVVSDISDENIKFYNSKASINSKTSKSTKNNNKAGTYINLWDESSDEEVKNQSNAKINTNNSYKQNKEKHNINSKLNASNTNANANTNDKEIINNKFAKDQNHTSESSLYKKRKSLEYSPSNIREMNDLNLNSEIVKQRPRNKTTAKQKPEIKQNVYFFMQMEYCNGTSLNNYLDNRKQKNSGKEIFNFFSQIVNGVEHIHDNHTIHRDLKPANIFLSSNGSLKIGDFGLAASHESFNNCNIQNFPNKLTSLNHSKSSYHYCHQNDNIKESRDHKESNKNSIKLNENVGTPLYQSPEQLANKFYNEKVDIYAMGLVLLEMCSFYETAGEKIHCFKEVRTNHKLQEEVLHEFPLESELILLMTMQNPKNRPSIKEIIRSKVYMELKNKYSN